MRKPGEMRMAPGEPQLICGTHLDEIRPRNRAAQRDGRRLVTKKDAS